jgi:lipoyl(octanoyl) transferase
MNDTASIAARRGPQAAEDPPEWHGAPATEDAQAMRGPSAPEVAPDTRGPQAAEVAPHTRGPPAAEVAPEWSVAPGRTPYPDAMAAMQQRVAAIRAGEAAELVWLVEHPPLYTAGTSARPEDLTDPARFPTFAAGRGGQWTYHGPGQRTAYVMLDLTRPHGRVPTRDIGAYVRGLEAWLVAALARFGVQGESRPGRIGIWVTDPRTGAEAKIGAIGVRVTRWVSWHGVALNVAPDLSHFAGIVPCGISRYGVTSLAALGVAATMADADAALRAAWQEVF